MSLVIDRSLEIAAPAAIVWEVITDMDAYGQWNPFVPHCRSTLEPGSTIEMMVNLGGRQPRRQVEWISSVDPGRGFAYSMKPLPFGALSSERDHRIEALDAHNTRYRSHFALQGWLMPLVRRLSGVQLEKGFSGMAQGIKRRAERLAAQRGI